MTRVSVLTPPGTGAIATVAVIGKRAWELVRAKFHPAKGTLPESPPLHRFWFGTISNQGDGAGDEVIVAVRQVEPEMVVEIHCHGGRRVVQWVLDMFAKSGCEVATKPTDGRPWAFDGRALDPLTHATTTRTASILLDQYHNAFTRTVQSILVNLPDSRDELARLATLAPVGRHLVEPWRVVVAGPPNVGKSSLINALAGFQRSVVAPVAGTTRDVVTVRIAADGWPIELSDTAGLRDAAESLEAAGIELAKRELASADVVVWVMDTTDPNPVWPPDDLPTSNRIVVLNKCDQPTAWSSTDLGEAWGQLRVSATTGEGLPALFGEIVRLCVPTSPLESEAVPYTPELADRIERAHAAATTGNLDTTRELLRSCLSPS
jgi:tRNA modification GTPase